MIHERVNTSQAAQKFNKLIVKGLCANQCDVDVVVCLDFHRKPGITEEIFFSRRVRYFYVRKKDMYTFAKDWCLNHRDGMVLADSLNQWADGIVKAAKRNHNRIVLHITDLPMYLYQHNTPVNLLKKLKAVAAFFRKLRDADDYIILTKQMQKRLRLPAGRCLVMEGLIDSEVCHDLLCNAGIEENRFVYTGILSKQYGLGNLVEAFCTPALSSCTLSLYGTGDYVDEIVEISKKSPNIRYEGYVTNSVAIEAQRQAF
jgi:hypothetical protein